MKFQDFWASHTQPWKKFTKPPYHFDYWKYKLYLGKASRNFEITSCDSNARPCMRTLWYLSINDATTFS